MLVVFHHELKKSYRACHRVARSSGSNFYYSFSLLRPAKRHAMMALYAYARIIDDLGDDQENNKVFNEGRLHNWIEQLGIQTALHESQDEDLLTDIRLALIDTIQCFDIPLERLHEMIQGVALDQSSSVRITDQAALDRYCYLVACSVGQACLSIWDDDHKSDKKCDQRAAIDCGVAFQLTNILRDIAEDAKANRIYIPLSSFEEFSVNQNDWLQGKPNGDWQAMLRTYIDRAKQLYDSGWNVYDGIDVDSQRMFSLIWNTYRRLLDRIEQQLDDLWNRRVGLNRFEKIQLYSQHAITPCFQHLQAKRLKKT